MIRATTRKAMLAAALTLCAGAVAINCSSDKTTKKQENLGSVGLAVKISSGAEIVKVDYQITGNGITPITGSIDVSGKNAVPAVLVNGLPAGTGYQVTMTAVSTDGKTNCSGAATCDVVAGQTSSVSVIMQCRAPSTTGSVSVGGSFNSCPVLTSYTVSPLTADVNGVITLAASASDADAGDTLTISWASSTGATLAAGANSSFTCTPGGTHTLTVTVSDGNCQESADVQVNCISDSCGNGVVEPAFGEECEPSVPGPSTCSADCLIVPVCGNSVVEKMEQCDPPNGTTCDSQCNGIPVVCGNNIVQPGEDCDPPQAGVCTAECKSFVARCGDGTVNQASEECDDGNNTDGDGCSADCKVQKTACQTCEEANCDPSFQGCQNLTGEDLALCQAVVQCIRTNKSCANGSDLQACYCGTASDAQCLSTGANGPCKAQIEAAAKTTSGEEAAVRFYDPSFPVGNATNLILCDIDFCSAQCLP